MKKERPLDSAVKTSGLLTGCDCLSFYPQGAFSTHTTQFVRYNSNCMCLRLFLCNICSPNRLSGDLQISKDRAAEAKAKAKESV